MVSQRQMDDLMRAAKALLSCIEENPGGYDYRPYYTLRRQSQLCDTSGAVIRLRKAVDAADASEKAIRKSDYDFNMPAAVSPPDKASPPEMCPRCKGSGLKLVEITNHGERNELLRVKCDCVSPPDKAS